MYTSVKKVIIKPKIKPKLAPKTIRDYVTDLVSTMADDNTCYTTIHCGQGHAIVKNEEVISMCISPEKEQICIQLKSTTPLVLTGVNFRKRPDGSSKIAV